MTEPALDQTVENDGEFLEPTQVTPLTGNEVLGPGISVRDFWSWGFSDLRLNKTRGLLAQFLVARALRDERPTDEGWGNFDVLTPEGIRVEVKSSAYLQSWRQRRLSAITFTGLSAHSWTDDAGYSPEREIRADVFVFAIHTCREPKGYDMLDLSSRQFRVLPASTIKRLGQRSMSWGTLVTHAPDPTTWAELGDAVRIAAEIGKLAPSITGPSAEEPGDR